MRKSKQKVWHERSGVVGILIVYLLIVSIVTQAKAFSGTGPVEYASIALALDVVAVVLVGIRWICRAMSRRSEMESLHATLPGDD